jgi:hypothetical protein
LKPRKVTPRTSLVDAIVSRYIGTTDADAKLAKRQRGKQSPV